MSSLFLSAASRKVPVRQCFSRLLVVSSHVVSASPPKPNSGSLFDCCKTVKLTTTTPATSRWLSTTAATTPSIPDQIPTPPTDINEDIMQGVQDSTNLFINHGLGKFRLEQIAAAKKDDIPLVIRWQKMMEAYLGTQVHVLAGLGYPANEQGIGLYHQQLGRFLQQASPDVQEEVRLYNRDIWRMVLCRAFDLTYDYDEQEEMTIVDARNMMHKISTKMQDPEIIEMVAKKCANVMAPTEKEILAQKHTLVQEVLVNHVYLGGETPLVEELGFEPSEEGYVRMQCAMAEHQNDPLVAQYVGSGMMRLLQAAGIDLQQAMAQQ